MQWGRREGASGTGNGVGVEMSLTLSTTRLMMVPDANREVYFGKRNFSVFHVSSNVSNINSSTLYTRENGNELFSSSSYDNFFSFFEFIFNERNLESL